MKAMKNSKTMLSILTTSMLTFSAPVVAFAENDHAKDVQAKQQSEGNSKWEDRKEKQLKHKEDLAEKLAEKTRSGC